jgi:hypothetical protein
MTNDQDLENLIIAHVLGEQSRLGPEFLPEEIFAWTFRGEREILNSTEIEAAKIILKNAHSNYESEINVNGRTFKEGRYGIFEVKAGALINIANLIEPGPSDNCVRHMNVSGDLLLIGDHEGKIFALDTNAQNAKPYLFHCYGSFNPILHLNLLSGQKLLVQYVGRGTVLFDKVNGEEHDLNNTCEITRSAEFKTSKTLKCLVLGTGNIACEKNTSFIIEADKKYLVDAPTFLEQMLKENNQDISQINDVILTHTHPDHFNGLEQFLHKKIKAKEKLNIYTTGEIYRQALDKLSPWIKTQVKDNVEFKELNTKQVYNNDSIEIVIRNNYHEKLVPTIGFKFTYNNKKIGYSSDCHAVFSKYGHCKSFEFANGLQTIYFGKNMPGDFIKIESKSDERRARRLIRKLEKKSKTSENKLYLNVINEKNLKNDPHWFSDCNLIIHEADDSENEVHTNVKELEALPENIRSKLYITHLPPEFQERYKGTLRILKEGARYRL